MKNRYSNQRQSSTPLWGAFMLVLLISVALFGFDTITGGLARSYVRTMGSLAWTAAAGTIGAIDLNGTLRTRSSLAQENHLLKEQLTERAEQDARFQALQSENDTLRELAHLAEVENGGISARVLSSYRTSPYGTLVIGLGTNNGIEKGSAVLTPSGFFLGVISDIDARTSTVETVFAPAKNADLLVNDIAFSATGSGGGNAKAEIPRDAIVAVGDAVRIPAFGSRVVGVIGSIQSASSSATQTLFIRIPVNLDALQFVYVLAHKK